MEYLPSIKEVASAIPWTTYEIAAVASQGGLVFFNVHHDLVGVISLSRNGGG
jgi:hypothetical protein